LAGTRAGLRRVVVETLMVTPSGALSPGPLSASAVAAGAVLGPAAGLLIALGHMAFELPYVAALTKWAELLTRVARRYEKPMALAVAAFIYYFALGLAAEAAAILNGKPPIDPQAAAIATTPLGAVATGVALTAFNPYFLLWWATVGLPLVQAAAENGPKGFAAMYTSHVWMDYAWLTLLAALGAGLSRLAGLYAALLAALAATLAAFATDILLKAYTGRKLLPF